MRPDGVAERVHRPQPLLEGRGAHRRRAHHVGARLEVSGLGDGGREVLPHQPQAFERDALAHRVVVGGAISLEAMGEGVHAGAHRDRAGHADRQFGIADHHRGQQAGVEDDLLLMGGRVGQHARAPDLGSRARGGGDRHDGRDGRGVGAGPPVVDVLEVPHRDRLAGHQRDQLAQIEARSAAEGDHPVVPALVEGVDAGLEVIFVGVGVDLGEDRAAEPRRLHQVQRLRGDRQGRKAPVGDQQRPRDARGGAGLGQFGNPPRAEADGGGIAPVGSRRGHGQPFFRW